jgi:histidinol-phosphate aminotransferase
MVDEAYIEFSSARSWCQDVNSEPGLAVLRTLSKAHALAGIRLGALIAHPVITALVRKIIPPYAVPQPTVDAALRALQPAVLAITNERIKQLIAERNRLATALLGSPWVERIYPSDANFLLLGTRDPETIMSRAASSRLLLRNFSGRGGLAGAVRVSMGTEDQNNRLLAALEASVS